MNTIITKGSYRAAIYFMNEGGELSTSKIDNIIYEKYYQYLMGTGIKKSSILQKFEYLYLFEEFLISLNRNLKTFSRNDVYDYIDACSKLSWGYSYQDRNKEAIKLFLNWAYQYNHTKISGDMVLPKIQWHRNTNIKSYYTPEEITKLFNAVDTKTNQGKEDYLVLSLTYYLELRISDVVNLKISNIDFNDNIINIIIIKTGEPLILPLIDEIRYPLLDYLKNVRPQDTELDYVFITAIKPYRNKKSIKSNSSMVEKYLKKGGVDIAGRKHGFHALRHSGSTSLLNNDTSVYDISTILGHKNINQTMTYLDIDVSKLKELALEVPDVK